MGLTRRPSSVPAAIASRSISPVATCGIRYSAAIRFACVPLPVLYVLSCAPPACLLCQRRPRSARPLSQEALVGAHHHLRLHLPHRVERDADDDQHRRAAEGARGRLRETAVTDEEAR